MVAPDWLTFYLRLNSRTVRVASLTTAAPQQLLELRLPGASSKLSSLMGDGVILKVQLPFQPMMTMTAETSRRSTNKRRHLREAAVPLSSLNSIFAIPFSLTSSFTAGNDPA
jgi:hypothetical protein